MDQGSLRASGVFRPRGQQVTRLETFVDAAFAFSLTLVVIFQNDLPVTVAEMREALRRIPTFMACFALLMMFWAAHNRWSRRFGLSDALSVVLSLTLVLVMLVYVYPLRMVASQAMSMLTRGWVPSELGAIGAERVLDVQSLFIVYSTGFGLMALLMWALNAHAGRQADALALDMHERFDLASETGMFRIMTITALASIALSALVLATATRDSAWLFAAPMWAYAVMGAWLPWYWHRRDRARPGFAAGAGAGPAPATQPHPGQAEG